jgi:hypothetical protein
VTTSTAPLDVTRERARLRRIAKAEDPAARAERAGEIAARAQDEAQRVRTDRDQAATALRLIHGWEPKDVYRLVGVTRSLYARIIARNEKRGIDPAYKDLDHARKVAEETAGVPEKLDALARQARDVRDPAICELAARTGEDRMTNVQIAALAKVTGQRVAQLAGEDPS